ncbi:hypothetical protein GPECTOR_110g233 [Gonium pectorale]|uniref:Uncharacterized protein n=1 Tax=Gonium pectorale TaxID=33097 RepID=A0A150G0U4_GONPE|nr:hypothetical protein GPECTOR_110g233 [Gonium pectorale]|eukprot:KXZ42940.1 hypothetical protein GPECTOR_110g233 [Gonium pectorale]
MSSTALRPAAAATVATAALASGGHGSGAAAGAAGDDEADESEGATDGGGEEAEEGEGGEDEEGGGVLLPVSEADINGAGADPRAARLLVVCSKYETGYDDPRLGALFIDRALSGGRAVQVLGRINRPAPALRKAAGLLAVVDFANSAGALREAFEAFFDVTVLTTGKAARRLRQQRQMESALCRILEQLQPAADRAAAAAAGGGDGGGSLMRLGVAEMAALAGGLPPDARSALEADLAAYVSLSGSLRAEAAEMPRASRRRC